jgi:hypothetical protein
MIGALPVSDQLALRRASCAQTYFPLRGGSWTGTCGEVLTTLGPPSAWVWPRVLISDSSIRKNFSASMAVSPSLRAHDATGPGFQAVFQEAQKRFLRLDELFRRDSLRKTGSRDRWGWYLSAVAGQGKTAKIQDNILSEFYELTFILYLV